MKSMSLKEHHFNFVLEFLKVRDLFLRNCVGNKEEACFLLNKLFWHFDCLTANNIRKYRNDRNSNEFYSFDFGKKIMFFKKVWILSGSNM